MHHKQTKSPSLPELKIFSLSCQPNTHFPLLKPQFSFKLTQFQLKFHQNLPSVEDKAAHPWTRSRSQKATYRSMSETRWNGSIFFILLWHNFWRFDNLWQLLKKKKKESISYLSRRKTIGAARTWSRSAAQTLKKTLAIVRSWRR